MKTPLKAVLLSALVFPGAGHFYLKKQISGIIFLTAFSLSCYYLIKALIDKAVVILKQIETGQISLDILSISHTLSNYTEGISQQALKLQIFTIFVIWLVSIVDVYRIARVNK